MSPNKKIILFLVLGSFMYQGLKKVKYPPTSSFGWKSWISSLGFVFPTYIRDSVKFCCMPDFSCSKNLSDLCSLISFLHLISGPVARCGEFLHCILDLWSLFLLWWTSDSLRRELNWSTTLLLFSFEFPLLLWNHKKKTLKLFLFREFNFYWFIRIKRRFYN